MIQSLMQGVEAYQHLALPQGIESSLHVLPFDRHGSSAAPEATARLLNEAAHGDFDATLFFIHGWNTDWAAAVEMYTHFYSGFAHVAAHHSDGIRATRPLRLLLIGIFWPSVSLVMPWEQAPHMASPEPPLNPEEVRQVLENLTLESVAASVALLTAGTMLDEQAALDLADLLTPLYQGDKLDDQAVNDLHSAEIVQLWQGFTPRARITLDQYGFATTAITNPQMAGGSARMLLSPRTIIRYTTVWQMKDRAARIGVHGVAELLRDLLAAAPQTPLHLIGHSFGCKVLLSALHAYTGPILTASVLLLQGAVSAYCFADTLPGIQRPGGYYGTLARTLQPLWCTYSVQDTALALFPGFLRRPHDLGETKIASDGVNQFSALGYTGPQGVYEQLVHLHAHTLGVAYPDFAPDARIVAINSNTAITSHSDIDNSFTQWMLYQQVVRSQ